MLGPLHETYMSYKKFVHTYANREDYFEGRLRQLNLSHGPALLVRHNQLQLTNWFRESRLHRVLPPVPPPDFSSVLNHLKLSTSSWVPTIPSRYLTSPVRAVLPPPAAGPTLPTNTPPTQAATLPGAERTNKQVVNPSRSRKFDPFQEMFKTRKLNDGIARAGNVPTVMRGGVAVPMCASYHAKGRCLGNCKRLSDHGPHTDAEDDLLVGWCVVAMA
jgi:hypothetical protein